MKLILKNPLDTSTALVIVLISFLSFGSMDLKASEYNKELEIVLPRDIHPVANIPVEGGKFHSDLALPYIEIRNISKRELRLEGIRLSLIGESGQVLKSQLFSKEIASQEYYNAKLYVESYGSPRFNIPKDPIKNSIGGPRALKHSKYSSSNRILPGEALALLEFNLFKVNSPEPASHLEVEIILGETKKLRRSYVRKTPLKTMVSKNRYSLPVRGEWRLYGHWLNKKEDYHRGSFNQEFALDLGKYNEVNKDLIPGVKKATKLTDYSTFGQALYSMGDGKVVAVVGDIEDTTNFRKAGWDRMTGNYFHGKDSHWKPHWIWESYGLPAFFLGNYIMIEHANGEYSYYGHVKANSQLVKVGQVVNRGQQIAQVGNSGNTSGPHLHFALLDNMDLTKARSIPMEFDNLKMDYKHLSDGYIWGKDYVTGLEHPNPKYCKFSF